MGTVIKAVISTGDFEGRHAERFLEIYTQLSSAASLIPPGIAFLFDDEGRREEDKKTLASRGRKIHDQDEVDRVYFTERRMYENYLLHIGAIEAVLSRIG